MDVSEFFFVGTVDKKKPYSVFYLSFVFVFLFRYSVPLKVLTL